MNNAAGDGYVRGEGKVEKVLTYPGENSRPGLPGPLKS